MNSKITQFNFGSDMNIECNTFAVNFFVPGGTAPAGRLSVNPGPTKDRGITVEILFGPPLSITLRSAGLVIDEEGDVVMGNCSWDENICRDSMQREEKAPQPLKSKVRPPREHNPVKLKRLPFMPKRSKAAPMTRDGYVLKSPTLTVKKPSTTRQPPPRPKKEKPPAKAKLSSSASNQVMTKNKPVFSSLAKLNPEEATQVRRSFRSLNHRFDIPR